MNASQTADLFPSIPLWRSFVVLGLAAATVAACFWATPPPKKSEAGISLNLPQSFGSFSGEKQDVSEAEKVILPRDTEFSKMLYTNPEGDKVMCQVVLAGGEKRSIHRPEVCLPGQGWTLKASEVIPVKLSDGRTLKVTKLLIGRPVSLPNGTQKELTSLFLYWFVGKDVATPSHITRILKTNLDMLLHNTNHRWAYVVVSTSVLDGLVPNGKNADQALELAKALIANVAPAIMTKP